MISKTILLKSNKNIFDILCNMERYDKDIYFPNFESIENYESQINTNSFTTKRKITFKNVLPKIIFVLLSPSIFNQINTYTDYSIWYPNKKYYDFNISCANWYKSFGNAQFFNDNSLVVNMDFEITKNFPKKNWVESMMKPFIVEKYIQTIKHIDKI
jgi:hypothetical protein